jgi:hypothetical protein
LTGAVISGCGDKVTVDWAAEVDAARVKTKVYAERRMPSGSKYINSIRWLAGVQANDRFVNFEELYTDIPAG